MNIFLTWSEQEQKVAHGITTDLVRHSWEFAKIIIENLGELLEDFIIGVMIYSYV